MGRGAYEWWALRPSEAVGGLGVEKALIVVWADPGVHTGWSVHRVPVKYLLANGQVGAVSRLWWRSGAFHSRDTSANVDSYLGLARAAWERAGEEDIVAIGTEGFTLMMQTKDPDLLEPVRFNAVLKDRLRGSGVPLEVQSAGDAKKTINDARLKLWGLWKPGPDHMRDAQRHGLLFLRRFASQVEVQKRYGW